MKTKELKIMSEKIDSEESVVRSEKSFPEESVAISYRWWKTFALIICVAMLTFSAGYLVGSNFSTRSLDTSLGKLPAECPRLRKCEFRGTVYKFPSVSGFETTRDGRTVPTWSCRTCAAG